VTIASGVEHSNPSTLSSSKGETRATEYSKAAATRGSWNDVWDNFDRRMKAKSDAAIAACRSLAEYKPTKSASIFGRWISYALGTARTNGGRCDHFRPIPTRHDLDLLLGNGRLAAWQATASASQWFAGSAARTRSVETRGQIGTREHRNGCSAQCSITRTATSAIAKPRSSKSSSRQLAPNRHPGLDPGSSFSLLTRAGSKFGTGEVCVQELCCRPLHSWRSRQAQQRRHPPRSVFASSRERLRHCSSRGQRNRSA